MAPASEERGPTVVSAALRDKATGHSRRWWLGGLLAGPVAFVFSSVAGQWPELTEAVYGQWIGPTIGWGLARATGWLPFSIAEWALLLAIIHWLGRWITASRLDGTRLRALGRATALNLREFSIVLAIFTVVFGMQYRRPPLAERMDWDQEIPDDLLLRCAEASVEEVNKLYEQLHGSEDAGVPTSFDDGFDRVDRSLERAWPAVADEFGLGRAASWTRGRSKGLLISPLLARLGLSGFYFPWTGEANRNRDVPAARQAHVTAHEKAHQRGVAREDEANFLGWAVARRSEEPLARYSAAMYAHRRFALALQAVHGERARELVEARHPGVQRDVNDVYAYWARHQGRATLLAESLNDRYLRGHNIPDGTLSYARSLRLLLLYAASQGGSLPTLNRP